MSISTLSAATHAITATYSGDNNFQGSSDNSLSQVVGKASTTTAISSSSIQSVVGQLVTFTAKISVTSPGAGTPSGTVDFFDNTTQTDLGQVTLANNQATLAISTLTVASHNITATYRGDSNFQGSSDSSLNQTVNPANTTTTISTSLTPSVFGLNVTFTATVNLVAPGSGTLSGTVDFFDSTTNTDLGSAPLSGGTAQRSTSVLSAASHSIKATYSGNSIAQGSSSSLSQQVNPADTTTTISSSTGSNPSLSTQNVTFTAAVSPVPPGSGTPTGTVQFVDSSSNTILGTSPLVNGTATLMTSAVAAGNHVITATYSGSSNFRAGPSTSLTQTVNAINSSVTTLTTSLTPSVFGQNLTFLALVSPFVSGFANPTGSVDFVDSYTDSTGNSTTVDLGSVPLSGGAANLTLSTLSASSHTIKAIYSGDSVLLSSSISLAQQVNPANTTTTLSTSSGSRPAQFGHNVTFTATVSAVALGSGTPTGTVQFVDTTANVVLGTVPVVAGSASLSTSALTIGNHVITATYGSSSTNFKAGPRATLTQVVNPDNSTSTTLTSSANGHPVFGQSVTFTATVKPVVSGGNTPTGSIDFIDNYVDQNNNPITFDLGSFSLSGGSASLTISALLPVGKIRTAHQITATYSSDSIYDISSSLLVQQVDPAPTSTTILSSTGNSPSLAGQGITFTATVSPIAPGNGNPTGSVRFYADGTSIVLGTVPLAGGVATLNTAALSVGNHNINATYLGDSFFSASGGTLSQFVNSTSGTTTVTTVTSSATDSLVFGQTVTFTATVNASTPDAGTPTGSIAFSDTFTDRNKNTVTVNLGSVSLSGGTASLSTSSLLAAGSILSGHQITATYGGNLSFQGSSNSVVQQVNPAQTTTTLSSSTNGNPVPFGQGITFTASVSPLAPGAGIPGGRVDFTDHYTDLNQNPITVDLGTVPLFGGVARLTTSALLSLSNTLGSHQITANYSGDGNFQSSNNTISQEVDAIPAAPLLSSSSNSSLRVFGQNETFIAQVVPLGPSGGTPTGTVTFTDVSSNQVLGTLPLTSGAASLTTNALSAGLHTISAVYSGDANYQASPSPFDHLRQLILKAGTTTFVFSSSGSTPALVGQSVTFAANVSSSVGSSKPTGTVDFFDVTTQTDLGSVALTNGTASVSTSGLTGILHSIKAIYSGDSNFLASSSPSLSQAVNKVGVTTGVTSIISSTVYGQIVSLTATVSGKLSLFSAPTGTVQFQVDGVRFGLPVPVLTSNGVTQASLNTSALPAGTHSITAVYNGDANFAPSAPTDQGSVQLTVAKINLSNTVDPGQHKVYGSADPVLTYHLTSGTLLNGDRFSGTLGRTAGENVGNYAITLGSLSAGSNYSITLVSSPFAITPRSITVAADSKTKVVGKPDPILTYHIVSGSLAFRDAFTGSLTRVAGEKAGTYAILKGTLALNSNYTLTFVRANLMITAK